MARLNGGSVPLVEMTDRAKSTLTRLAQVMVDYKMNPEAYVYRVYRQRHLQPGRPTIQRLASRESLQLYIDREEADAEEVVNLRERSAKRLKNNASYIANTENVDLETAVITELSDPMGGYDPMLIYCASMACGEEKFAAHYIDQAVGLFLTKPHLYCKHWKDILTPELLRAAQQEVLAHFPSNA